MRSVLTPLRAANKGLDETAVRIPAFRPEARSDMEADALTHFATYAGFLFAQETTSGSSALGSLPFFLIVGGLFYVLLILPQRRRRKKAEEMRSGIEIGDEVRTIGGIIGTVVREDGDEFTIDIGGQTMRVVKRAIAEKTRSEEE
ncbi:MAG: preprotein translocase subunit YajC [Actinomycetota bacterium]